MKELKITQVPIGDLKESTYNPRTWDEVAEEKLKESIRRFGIVDPLVVNGAKNRKNIVIGGHFRLAVAKSLGYTQMPVVYVDIKDIEREKELNLRLNRNTGEFDLDLLKEFDVGMLLDIGFDDTDIGETWNSALAIEEDGFDVEQAVREIKKPKAQFGDLYQLGDHKILCGDATNMQDVARLVGDARMDLVTLDPVYGIGLNYANGISTKGKYAGAERDQLKGEAYRQFLKDAFTNALAVSKEDSHFFCWNDSRHIGLVQGLCEEMGLSHKAVCLWVKNNFTPTPGIAWNKSFEACVYSVRGKPWLNPEVKNLTEVLNREIDPGNRQLDDIISLFDIWLAKRLSMQEYLHCTQKPLTLYEKPIRRCSKVGANILELFSGSGTCLIACEQMKRKAFVMEKDPVFVDVCIQRFEELTGVKAKKIKS